MRLLERYNRINLIATIAIFLLSSVAFYFLIHYVLINQIDEDLKIEQNEISTYVSEYNRLPEPIPVKDQMITYHTSNEVVMRRRFSTLSLYHSLEKKREVFRQLTFGIEVNGIWYNALVAKSLESTDSLIRSILLIVLAAVLLILLAGLLINRFVLKNLWRPFYEALDTLRSFKLQQHQQLKLPTTTIDEFAFMNAALETTANQAQFDYFLLKEFTENASHEMQTPLAVIKSKLDLLIQNEVLTSYERKAVQSSYEAIQKLSRLNQTLLLLAKIENKQFGEVCNIDFAKRIQTRHDDFLELWKNQHIEVSMLLNPCFVEMNSDLADILLSNLLSNATRHNQCGGTINIELHANKLIVSNTSNGEPLDPARLFTRFYKHSALNKTTGLGLSIIKQIGEASGLQVSYNFHNDMHVFEVAW